jgi:hypothetical protein
LLNSALAWLIAISFFFLIRTLFVLREEPLMRETFGQEYDDFWAAVRRWIWTNSLSAASRVCFQETENLPERSTNLEQIRSTAPSQAWPIVGVLPRRFDAKPYAPVRMHEGYQCQLGISAKAHLPAHLEAELPPRMSSTKPGGREHHYSPDSPLKKKVVKLLGERLKAASYATSMAYIF